MRVTLAIALPRQKLYWLWNFDENSMKKFFTSSASAIFFSNNSTPTDSLNILNPIFFPVEIHIQLPKLVQIVYIGYNNI